MLPEPPQPGKAHALPCPTHLPGDLDALRRHRLQGDIHRRPVGSCTSTDPKQSVEKHEGKHLLARTALGFKRALTQAALLKAAIPTLPTATPARRPQRPCREPGAAPASSVLMVSSLLGSLRPILLKEYMRMLYTEAGCRSTMFAWLMVGEMLRVDCLKSQESGKAAERDRTVGTHIPPQGLQHRGGRARAGEAPEHLWLSCPA